MQVAGHLKSAAKKPQDGPKTRLSKTVVEHEPISLSGRRSKETKSRKAAFVGPG